MMKPFRAVTYWMMLGFLLHGAAFAQYRGVAGDVFTYQGELRYEGMLVDGEYDVEFRLYSDGTSLDTIAVDNLLFDNGVFTTELQLNDFFRDLIDPEVSITIFDLNSPGGSLIFPRRPIVAAPYAYIAEGVANGAVDSDSIVNNSIKANDVDSSEIQHRVIGSCGTTEAIRSINGNGSVVCVDVSGSAGGWALTGNAGTSVGTNFIGTTDDVAFDVRVNDQRAMRFQWGFNAAGSPNIVAGHANNSIAGSEEASTIAGGGLAAAPNTITGSYSFIGGGIANSIDANYGAILGGKNNEVSGTDGVAVGSNAKALHNNTFVFSDGTSFASTADDQFLIEADGGVGIGLNNPSDFVHISAPPGDALRVQIDGTTRLRVHDNGGVSVGVNSGPPAAGLLVQGQVRTNTPVTRWRYVQSAAWMPADNTTEWETRPIVFIMTKPGSEIYDALAPIQLPHGAVVTELRVWVSDNQASGNQQIRLARYRPNQPPLSDDTMAVVSTNGASPGIQELVDSTIADNTIDNENYEYFMTFQSGTADGDQLIYGTRITYTTTDLYQ